MNARQGATSVSSYHIQLEGSEDARAVMRWPAHSYARIDLFEELHFSPTFKSPRRCSSIIPIWIRSIALQQRRYSTICQSWEKVGTGRV